MSWIVGFIGIGVGIGELISLLILGGGALGVVLLIRFIIRKENRRSTILQEIARLRDENERLHDEIRSLRSDA